MLFRKTGATTKGVPVETRHWREVIDEADAQLSAAAESMDEEAVLERWLENPQDFMQGAAVGDQQVSAIRRVHTGGLGLGRYTNRRVASSEASVWDQDFEDARAHAQAVLRGDVKPGVSVSVRLGRND